MDEWYGYEMYSNMHFFNKKTVKDQLEARILRTQEQQARELERLRDRLARYESLPKEDELPDDAVLFFRKNFESGGIVYTYAAMRTINENAYSRWWVTGPKQSGHAMTYEELCDLIAEHGNLMELWLATQWEELA